MLSITIASAPAVVTTIWPNSAVPALVDNGAGQCRRAGGKIQVGRRGNDHGIRFYKASANTGAHIGNLWTSTGTRLATVTFTNETASGWQQALFDTPVAIASNTVYVASYHANTGHYSCDTNYFAGRGVDNTPLHALANGVSGGNSVYAYGASSTFPTRPGMPPTTGWTWCAKEMFHKRRAYGFGDFHYSLSRAYRGKNGPFSVSSTRLFTQDMLVEQVTLFFLSLL